MGCGLRPRSEQEADRPAITETASMSLQWTGSSMMMMPLYSSTGTSRASQSKRRVEMLGLTRAFSVVNRQLALVCFLLRSASQASTSRARNDLSDIRGKNTQFGLCQVEPAAVFWGVMPLEPF